LEEHGSLPQGATWGVFLRGLGDSLNQVTPGNALWKLTVLCKNQRTVFPQDLEPSVHSSHNAGCCWTFL